MPYMEHMGMSTLPSPFPIHADLRAKSIAGTAEGFTSRTPRLAGLALAVVPWWQRQTPWVSTVGAAGEIGGAPGMGQMDEGFRE